MPDSSKTSTAPDATKASLEAPDTPVSDSAKAELKAGASTLTGSAASVTKQAGSAVAQAQSSPESKASAVASTKPVATAENKTQTSASAAKLAAMNKPAASMTNAEPIKPMTASTQAVLKADAAAVPVKSATNLENKAQASVSAAKSATVNKSLGASASSTQPNASAAPKAPIAVSTKSAATAENKAQASAPAAKQGAVNKPAASREKPAESSSKPMAQSTAAVHEKPVATGGKTTASAAKQAAASKPAGAAAAQSKASAMPPSKSATPDKNNLPSTSTGNELQKKEDDKLATSRGGKLVIPDLILTARPVVTTVEKITSRLSPGMKFVLFALLVPTFLSLIYFGLWASPMYIAEARFAVRGASNSPIDTGGLASMLLPAGSSVGTDVNIVAEYIQSPDIMEAVDRELHIFDHFASHDYDIISRLESDATRDERLSYWQWAVKPSLDPETGIIALSVKAYEPEMAQKLAEAVLAKSEALVNAMSRRAQDDAITLAMREVKTAENRVSKAQEAMRSFRDRSGMLDPTSTAGGLQGIVSELESEVVKTKAQIAEASTYMSKDAPALVGLRARLAAVEKQLAAEKLRLAGEAKPGSMTSIAGEYEDLQIESEFARQQLVSAMTSLEAARVKAEAQSRYVVAFQVPVLPDESLYPRPFLFTLFVFVGSLVIVGIFSLIIAAVREHAGF